MKRAAPPPYNSYYFSSYSHSREAWSRCLSMNSAFLLRLCASAACICGAHGAFGDISATVNGALSGARDTVDGTINGALGSGSNALSDALSSGTAALRGALGSGSDALKGAVGGLDVDLGPLTGGIDAAKEQIVNSLTSQAETAAAPAKTALQHIVTIAEKVATPKRTFLAENILVLPLWGGMIFAPNNKYVQKIMEGYSVIILAALVYAWLTYEALQNPVSLAGFSGGAFDLDTLTKGFTQEVSVADGWAHFIAQDLFVGRWVYLDSKRNSVWAAHSLALCYLFGPIGVLSHLLTRGLSGIFRQDVTDILDIGVATERETKAPKSKPKAALPPSLPPSAPAKPAVAPRGASLGSSGAQSTAMRSSSGSSSSSSNSSAPSKAATRASSSGSSGSGAGSTPTSSASAAAANAESKSKSVSAAQQQAIIVDADVVSSQPVGDTADRSAGKTTA
ncbi:hypothetical protein JKP88DRAFT_319194 [Tribonema minus]|uniref:Uncharacterized protein n=1 Tax=Tribonema minus TaxID=303371 RepID=A0A835YXE1_9STRA|nr:hypothetical protein JKP88DRAFT_319194 [Tribonema minus]